MSHDGADTTASQAPTEDAGFLLDLRSGALASYGIWNVLAESLLELGEGFFFATD